MSMGIRMYCIFIAIFPFFCSALIFLIFFISTSLQRGGINRKEKMIEGREEKKQEREKRGKGG